MTAAPAAARSLHAMADFGDWLPAMMVKELRHGLRTSRFVGAFVILQSLLVMTLLITRGTGNAQATSHLFWGIVAGALVLVIPIRGFTALPAEAKSHSLPLLALTRLSSLRITSGIWLAVVAQSGLAAITVLPYVLMRYYSGGISVSTELTCLLVLLMLSALVTAMAVASSAVPSLVLRCLLGAAIAALAVGAVAGIMDWVEDEESLLSLFDLGGSSSDRMVIRAGIGLFWAFLCYFILDMGASAISPCTYDGPPRKRLIAFITLMGLLFLGTGGILGSRNMDALVLALVITLGLASIDCLTEAPTALDHGTLAPFLRHGRAGRWGAHFLAPGWATGVLYYLTLAVLTAAAFAVPEFPFAKWLAQAVASNENFEPSGWFALANALLTPPTVLALALVTFRRSKRVLVPCLVCGMSLALVTVGISVFADEAPDLPLIAVVAGATPPTALAFSENVSYIFFDQLSPITLTGGLFTGAGALAIVLTKSWAYHRRLRESLAIAVDEASKPRA